MSGRPTETLSLEIVCLNVSSDLIDDSKPPEAVIFKLYLFIHKIMRNSPWVVLRILLILLFPTFKSRLLYFTSLDEMRGRACYGTLLWCIVMVHCYGALLWCIAMVHCYGALLWCIVMVHCYGASLWCIVMVHCYGALLWCIAALLWCILLWYIVMVHCYYQLELSEYLYRVSTAGCGCVFFSDNESKAKTLVIKLGHSEVLNSCDHNAEIE